MPDLKIVHVLRGGRALCGQPGLPKDWPANHWWARVEDAAHATCPECLKVLKGESKQ
jgi:hypothetical protein